MLPSEVAGAVRLFVCLFVGESKEKTKKRQNIMTSLHVSLQFFLHQHFSLLLSSS